MEIPRLQRTIAEIGHLAGWYGYLPKDHTDSTAQIIAWAEELEEKWLSYQNENWKETVVAFARGKMFNEVNRKNASFGNTNPVGIDAVVNQSRQGLTMVDMPNPLFYCAGACRSPVSFLSYDLCVNDVAGVEIKACRSEVEDGVIIAVEDNDNPEFFELSMYIKDDEDPFARKMHIVNLHPESYDIAVEYASRLRDFVQSSQLFGLDPVALMDGYKFSRESTQRSRP